MPATQGIAAIEFDHFSLVYCGAKRAQLQALRDLTLTIQGGEIITIVGPSGCGKTTFLRAVAGLLTPERDRIICGGSIKVFGISPLEAKRRRMFAFAFQNPALLPWRNVRQTSAYRWKLCREETAEIRAWLTKCLPWLDSATLAKPCPQNCLVECSRERTWRGLLCKSHEFFSWMNRLAAWMRLHAKGSISSCFVFTN